MSGKVRRKKQGSVPQTDDTQTYNKKDVGVLIPVSWDLDGTLETPTVS